MRTCWTHGSPPDCCRCRPWAGPAKRRDLDTFYPTSLLITGFDILFFWVARMIMMGCHFLADHERGMVPFRDVYIHGLVRDAERQKMSKTKGNVVDPIETIEKFGTDATRFTLATMAAPGADIAFSESRTESYRAFANKIWNAARFIFMNVERAEQEKVWSLREFRPADGRSRRRGIPGFVAATLEDRWILSRFNRVADEINQALTGYRFHEAAHVVYHFFWGEFCDWYIELVKPRLARVQRSRSIESCVPERRFALRGRAAHALAVHAVHHRRNLARGLRWQAAAEIDRAGPLSKARRSAGFHRG